MLWKHIFFLTRKLRLKRIISRAAMHACNLRRALFLLALSGATGRGGGDINTQFEQKRNEKNAFEKITSRNHEIELITKKKG
jgi:hypothetical protein